MSEGRSRRNVGVLIFDDVEVLDFCGPFEVFSVTRKLGTTDDAEALFNVYTVAEKGDLTITRGGMQVKPHYTFHDHPKFDLLVVPGGFGTRRERENPTTLRWIQQQMASNELTTSVCTGAFLLAALGVLDGKEATTHWASIEWMRANHPAVFTRDDQRVIDTGTIITSAGISAGIDMALYVVARLHGIDVARQTARYMEYHWDELGIGLEHLAAV
jgi:transcriptional regulator GlxA family with amidase domain